MHYAKTASQFHSKKKTALRQWLSDPDKEEFGKYFYKQWLFGKLSSDNTSEHLSDGQPPTTQAKPSMRN
ncbi:hypothetical protein GQ600_18603 [Phytophthora cactorum]|nr:hypothetical protein GQ600_18603 [Phytophthora cactorum]